MYTNEFEANIAWFLAAICSSNKNYLEAFDLVKKEQFFDAWCKFERVEIDLLGIYSNPFLKPSDFKIELLRELTANWQKTYPYKYYISPEFLNTKVVCSICESLITPWKYCGHKAGIVYSGQMCTRIIKKTELLGVALVTDPVQKFSALHTTQDAGGNKVELFTYDMVKYVSGLLDDPFEEWQVVWTRVRHPHERFSEFTSSDFCPCESGKLYADCCLNEVGVLRPHMQILLASYPSDDKLSFSFVERG